MCSRFNSQDGFETEFLIADSFNERNNYDTDVSDGDGDLLPIPLNMMGRSQKNDDNKKDSNQENDDFFDLERLVMDNMVEVTKFCISKYPVTQNIYEKVMGKNPSTFKDKSQVENEWTGLPVETVSFDDVITFCNRLSEMCGKSPCYDENGQFDDSKNGFRLPSETEWNYVANGGAEIPKDKYAGSDNENAVAWYDTNANGKTHDVREHELGVKIEGGEIFDLSGNVWEWCWKSNNETKAVCYGGSYNDSRLHLKLGTTFNKKILEKNYKESSIGFRISVNI